MTGCSHRFVRELLRSGNPELIGLLVQQVDHAIAAAEVVADPDSAERDDLESDVDQFVAESERVRAELVDHLGRALVTPMDREDLYRLSRAVHDVVDNLHDFVVELRLYGVAMTPSMLRMLGTLVVALESLRDGAASLQLRGQVLDRATAPRRLATELRRDYQSALAEIFAVDGITMELLAEREALRRLDVIGLRVREAADCLADGHVKRSH